MYLVSPSDEEDDAAGWRVRIISQLWMQEGVAVVVVGACLWHRTQPPSSKRHKTKTRCRNYLSTVLYSTL